MHHGVDPPPDARGTLSARKTWAAQLILSLIILYAEHLGRLRSLGKAGKAATKQLGKALTSLGETPDKRGQQLLYTAKAKQNGLIGTRERRRGQNARKATNVATGKHL